MFNNGPKLVTQGLDLLVDAADQQSYPGSGTVWRDLRSGTTGSLTGSVSYTSEFYGGLTFSNSSSAVIFPGSTANYGTGSFTVEMAFKPTFINGRHYLMSKNSGSFPNWAIYLSGSNGSGKLWSEFRINASVSCSVSSSTTFVTGSVYQVDVRILPALSASGIYVNGQSEGGVFGNGGGSLSSTASLFVGNFSQNNTQNFSGSIYTIKSYTVQSLQQPPLNYNVTATRLGKAPAPYVAPVFELLVVGGGGGGSNGRGGGGGAGGLQYFSNFLPTLGPSTIIVGSGGAVNTNGQPSSLNTFISYGGGTGGVGNASKGGDGASGGGGGREEGATSLGGGLAIYGPQGNNGASGSGVSSGLVGQAGGGGGGAGSPGFRRGGSQLTPDGGSGSYVAPFAAIGGSPAGWFAGGGGGSGQYGAPAGSGGIGGGGRGGLMEGPSAVSGSANTGGGGGGIDALGGGNATGGSGVVAIRYNGAPIAVGGEITQSEGFTYHVFRTVGTSSFTVF
jgi:hypothetical protein